MTVDFWIRPLYVLKPRQSLCVPSDAREAWGGVRADRFVLLMLLRSGGGESSNQKLLYYCTIVLLFYLHARAMPCWDLCQSLDS